MEVENPVTEVVEDPPDPTDPPPTPDPEPEPEPEPEPRRDDRPGWVDEIIGAINSLKDASPITEAEEEVLDDIPVRKPWTHRTFGHD